MMRAIVERFRRHGLSSTLSYSLGRFATVRRSYGIGVGALQQLGAIPGLKAVADDSLFAPDTWQRVAAAIDSDSAAFGLRLPPHIVRELEATSRSSRLRDWGSLREVDADSVVNGRLDDGSPVFTADVSQIDLCPAAIRVARDPLLIAAITAHSG